SRARCATLPAARADQGRHPACPLAAVRRAPGAALGGQDSRSKPASPLQAIQGMTAALVYEVTLDIEAGSAPEFDSWLKDHVKAMLALPGFHDARILKPEGAEPGSERRVVQYTLGSREELDQYLAEHAPRMRAEGVERFGDRMKASRRVLDVESTGGALAL